MSEHTFGCSESSSFSFFWPATLPEKNSEAEKQTKLFLHFYAHKKQTIPMSAIQFSSRAAVAPKISLKKSSKVSVRTGVRAQAVAARKC